MINLFLNAQLNIALSHYRASVNEFRSEVFVFYRLANLKSVHVCYTCSKMTANTVHFLQFKTILNRPSKSGRRYVELQLSKLLDCFLSTSI